MTGGLLSALIAARLCGIGFEIKPYASATALYSGFIDLAEEAAVRVRRQRLN